MIVNSREELANLINNSAIETYPKETKPGRKIMNTIIYEKKKDKFYRIEWGEIENEEKINFLWYNEIAEEVFLNPKGHEGWFTKKEIKKLERIGSGLMSLSKVLSNLETNLVDIGEDSIEQLDNVKIMGGKAGQGKTWYAMLKLLDAIINEEKVLFFSIELGKQEILERIVKLLNETEKAKEIWVDFDKYTKEKKEDLINSFISKAKVEIIDSYVMDTKYIIDKIFETHNAEGLDLVIIDSLQLSLNPPLRNSVGIQQILKDLEEVTHKINCKIEVTMQLNK